MPSAHDDDDFRDEDEILRALEREEDEDHGMARLREQRMEELKREMERLSEMRQNAHGTYETVTQEKELMRITTTTKLVVVSFFHKDFRRCQIMDKHLEALAKKHFRTKFVRIDVENAPFLVERLKIQILPCVLAFVDGISVDRLVGFEELGNNDNFTMAQLEKRLASKSEVIKLTADNAQPSKRKTVLGFPESGSDSDD